MDAATAEKKRLEVRCAPARLTVQEKQRKVRKLREASKVGVCARASHSARRNSRRGGSRRWSTPTRRCPATDTWVQ
jgi:hypothetical protein